MSTPATIGFATVDQTIAVLFKRQDGNTVDLILTAFFEHEQKLIDAGQHDNRFGAPAVLAARFISWHTAADGLSVALASPNIKPDWLVTCDTYEFPVITDQRADN